MACPECGASGPGTAPGWCGDCGRRERIGARRLLDWLVADAEDLAGHAASPDPLGWPGYPSRRDRARRDTDLDEAVIAARGRVAGAGGSARAVFVAWDFGFLGGSMGSEVGRRIAAAYDHAREAGLPVVLLPSTGGARMQEGMRSLVQMATTTVAADDHAAAGLLQVTVLRDPTTGGVFASHANHADLLLAETGATIGFAGPRVARAMTGGPLPEGSHTAAGARAAGLVDAVVDRPDLPDRLAAPLAWAAAAGTPPRAPEAVPAEPSPPPSAWDAVEAARAPDRPRLPAYLDRLRADVHLRGDRAGADDPAVRVALGRLTGAPVVVVGMDRTHEGGRVTPSGYRQARRGLRLADRLGVPVLTVVDTPGADASAPSEAGGIAHDIARTLRELLGVRSPTVGLVIGEGGSGGALALAVTDRLLIQERATFSVIAPEGAAAILHRDEGRAAEVAEHLRLTGRDLRGLGIADAVVAEPDGAVVTEAVDAVARAFGELSAVPGDERLAVRRRRWRSGRRPESGGGA